MKSGSNAKTDTLELWLDYDLGPPQQIGVVAHDDGRIRFKYTETWLADENAFALGPDLPLGTDTCFPHSALANFGALKDTCPNFWGTVLMQGWEILQSHNEGRDPRKLGAWDWMVQVQDMTRQGALRLRVPGTTGFINNAAVPAPPVAELPKLAATAQAFQILHMRRMVGNDPVWQALKTLFVPTTSLGGARPKANFLDANGTLWIAKFPAHGDWRDVGAWEFLVHRLARRAGIRVPEAKLLPLGLRWRTFCSKRFDRIDGKRRLYVSAMTLLNKVPGDRASYLEIAEWIASQDAQHMGDDLAQLFRRAVFNVAVGNRDDHLRNHGFLRERHAWRLAPAFDMNPDGHRRTHTLFLDDSDDMPSLDTVLATASFYELTPLAARDIVSQVVEVVRGWEVEATILGIPRSDIREGEGAFRAINGWVP